MPARQPLEMPDRYRFHSTRPALWKRVKGLPVHRETALIFAAKVATEFRTAGSSCSPFGTS
jgi:hypothetical protein